MNKEQALQLWDKLYPNKDVAYDYSAHEMRREDFQNDENGAGWDVDLKQPLSSGGRYETGNMVITSMLTMALRNGKSAFRIGLIPYEVRKGKAFRSFAIYDVFDRQHPINMDPSEENQDPEYNAKRMAISLGRDEKKIEDPTKIIAQTPRKNYFSFESVKNSQEKEDKEPEEVHVDVLTENVIPQEEAVQEKAMADEQQGVEETTTADETTIEETPVLEASGEEIVANEIENIEENATEEIAGEETSIEDVEETPVLENAPEEASEEVKEEISEEVFDEIREFETTLDEEPLAEEIVAEAIQPNESVSEDIVEEEVVQEEIETEEPETASEEEDSDQSLIEALEKENNELKATNEANNQQINELTQQIQSILAQFEESKENLKQLSLNEDETSSELNSQIDQLQSQNKQLTEKIEEVQNELKEAAEMKTQAEDALEIEKQNEENLSNQIRVLADENVKLKNEVLVLSDAAQANKDEQAQEKDDEIANLRNTLNSTNQAYESEKTESQALRQKNEDLTVAYSSLKHEKEELERKLGEKEVLLSDNESEKDEKIKELGQTEQNLKETIHSMEIERLNLTRDVQNLKDQLNEKEDKIQDLHIFVGSLRNDNQYKEAALQKAESELEEARRALNEKEDLLSNEKAEKDSLQKTSEEVEELKKALEEKESEIQQLKEENDTKDSALLDYASIKANNTEKEETIHQLTQKLNEMTESYNSVKTANASLNLQTNTLSIKTKEAEDTIEKLNAHIDEILALKEDKEKEILEKQNKIDSLEKELEEVKSLQNETLDTLSKMKEESAGHDQEVERISKDYDVLRDENEAKDIQLNEASEKYNALLLEKEEAESLIKTRENECKEKDEIITQLENKNLFLTLGGDEECYDIVSSLLESEEKDWTKENLTEIFENNKHYLKDKKDVIFDDVIEQEEIKEDITAISNQENEERIAKKLFVKIYGNDAYEVSDFAGREIKKDEYKNEKSSYGWDYVALDDENVVIASLTSLKDFKASEPFVSNGHNYEVQEDSNGKKKLISLEFITNPYNYQDTLRVIENTANKKESYIYIFVKALGVGGSKPDAKNLQKFQDLLERTAKRNCPKSYLNIKIVNDYAFLLFEGGADDAYKEAYRYAILLNSYRRQFNKEGLLNLIIVLGKFDAPFNARYLPFEKLTSDLHNKEFQAIRYSVNNVAVIDSMIKRTIHIGPSIFSDLKVDEEKFPISQLGKGNFASAYDFNDDFRECKFVYNIGEAEKK